MVWKAALCMVCLPNRRTPARLFEWESAEITASATDSDSGDNTFIIQNRGQHKFGSSDHDDSGGTLVRATLHFNQLLEKGAEKSLVLTQAKQMSMCARSSLWRLVG